MRKVYIDKTTNEVSQIIKEDYDHFEDYNENTFGDRFYMIEAEDGELKDHGYTFNKRTLLFEKIEGYVEETELVEIKTQDDRIKELENELAEMKSLLKSLLK